MQKNTIHAILAELLAREGITPTDLSRRTGVNQSTISRIINGKIKNPTDDQAYPLAQYFRITTEQLRGRQPLEKASIATKERQQEAVMDGPAEVWGDESPLPDDDVYVPFLKEIELAAGIGSMAIEINGNRKLRFGKYSLRNNGVEPENARCVSITGNSMEPILRKGSSVGVDLGRKAIADGDMYAINHGGMLRVKQVYRLPAGGLRLRSFNRDEHPDEDYTAQELQDQEISVIGRVFWGGGFF